MGATTGVTVTGLPAGRPVVGVPAVVRRPVHGDVAVRAVVLPAHDAAPTLDPRSGGGDAQVVAQGSPLPPTARPVKAVVGTAGRPPLAPRRAGTEGRPACQGGAQVLGRVGASRGQVPEIAAA